MPSDRQDGEKVTQGHKPEIGIGVIGLREERGYRLRGRVGGDGRCHSCRECALTAGYLALNRGWIEDERRMFGSGGGGVCLL